MDKKPIRLTEQDLHFLVENAVQAYLTENGMDEGAFNALWGAGKQAMGRMGNNIKNMGQNIRNTAQAGRNLSMIQKHKTNIENSLKAIESMDVDLKYPIEQIKNQLELTLQKYKGRLTTAQQNTFSTQNFNNNNGQG